MYKGEAIGLACSAWLENPILERNASPIQRWYFIASHIVRLAERVRDAADDVRTGALRDARVLFDGDTLVLSDEEYNEEMYTVNISEARELLTSFTEVKRVHDEALELLNAQKKRRPKE